MLKYAIISLNEPFSKKDQFLYTHNFRKKLNERIFQTILIEDTPFHVINLPYCMQQKEKPSKIKKFTELLIEDLKNRGVTTIFLQNNIIIPAYIKEKLLENFQMPTGESILHYCAYDVIKKYIKVNNSTTHESEIILFCENVEVAAHIITKICKKVHMISIVAENILPYEQLRDDIYKDYGLYINLSANLDDVMGRKKVYVNLAKNTDFFLQKVQVNRIPLLNLSGKEIRKENCINYITYQLKPTFDKLYPFTTYKDQIFLEYILFVLNNNCNDSLVEQFFKDYNIILQKIYAKNC